MKDRRKLFVWEPINNIGNILELIQLNINQNYLLFEFEDEQENILTVKYNKRTKNGYNVLAFRYTDEFTRSDLAPLAEKAQHDYFQEEMSGWSLYKMENSDFKDWFLKLNGIYEESEVKHYLYATHNHIYEVLSLNDPEVSMELKE